MEKQIDSDVAMKRFGAQLGALLRGGEVIELIGDVGAGKTTLTKGIASGMGVGEDVQSPSFTISRVYQTPDELLLSHYDFYRLQDAGIMADELQETLHDPKAVTIIEWADIVSGVIPEDHLSITITATSEEGRQLHIGAGGAMSAQVLEGLL